MDNPVIISVTVGFDVNREGQREVLRRLQDGRGRIAKGFCQGTFARAYDGSDCTSTSWAATQWCALGAVHADEGFDVIGQQAALCLLNEVFACTESPSINVPEFNDTHSQEEVLGLFDKVIAQLQAELCPYREQVST